MELSENEVPQECLVNVADIYEEPMAYGCEVESSNLRQYMRLCTHGPHGMFDMAHCLAEFLNADMTDCNCKQVRKFVRNLLIQELTCELVGNRGGRGALFNTLLAAIEPKKSTTAATTAAATTTATAATTAADTTAATTAEATT